MSALKDLINQIENPELRIRVQQEVDRLLGRKKFGLVFEEHLPESLQLPDVPIRRGSRVALRTGSPTDAMIIKSINGETATCFRLIDKQEIEVPLRDLVCVAQFGEPIYPYLKFMDKVKNAPNMELWHALIEADNYHALQLLAYLFPRKVTCIYIDPPYNTGARDWKYNNDYVDSSDQYRHSKWLAMMKRRLELAKLLLDPEDSALIVTIDEKEYLHLGCLLEEMFPEANIQMVTDIISGKGVSRVGQFSRVEEYVFFLTFGKMVIGQLENNMLTPTGEESRNSNDIEFLGFRRRNRGNYRSSRPHQFYPIIVDNDDGHIVQVGDDITPDVNRFDVDIPEGCSALWPLNPNGDEQIWSVVPETARILLEKGCLKVNNWNPSTRQGSVKYLPSGIVDKIDSGEIIIDERDNYGAIITGHIANKDDQSLRPRRVWHLPSHNASSFGTLLIKKYLCNKRFDFPKSLYSVHDTLRFVTGDKPDAIIVDFFAGSGTTLHAVNLLNLEDGGHRHCIMVTKVSVDEAENLSAQGFRPGDEEWERLGIARHVTWPRSKCSIIGKDVNGNAVDGEYLLAGTEEIHVSRVVKQIEIDVQTLLNSQKLKKQIVSLFDGKIPQSAVSDETKYLVSDEWQYAVLFDVDFTDDFIDELSENQSVQKIFVFTPVSKIFNRIKNRIAKEVPKITKRKPKTRLMSAGFTTNCIYFKLGFLDKNAVALGRQFRELLPLLWMKSGARGECPTIEEDSIPDLMALPNNHFAVLNEESAFLQLEQLIKESHGIDTVFIVTDSQPAFYRMQGLLPQVRCIQLYRDYLDNFRINFAK